MKSNFGSNFSVGEIEIRDLKVPCNKYTSYLSNINENTKATVKHLYISENKIKKSIFLSGQNVRICMQDVRIDHNK